MPRSGPARRRTDPGTACQSLSRSPRRSQDRRAPPRPRSPSHARRARSTAARRTRRSPAAAVCRTARSPRRPAARAGRSSLALTGCTPPVHRPDRCLRAVATASRAPQSTPAAPEPRASEPRRGTAQQTRVATADHAADTRIRQAPVTPTHHPGRPPRHASPTRPRRRSPPRPQPSDSAASTRHACQQTTTPPISLLLALVPRTCSAARRRDANHRTHRRGRDRGVPRAERLNGDARVGAPTEGDGAGFAAYAARLQGKGEYPARGRGSTSRSSDPRSHAHREEDQTSHADDADHDQPDHRHAVAHRG